MGVCGHSQESTLPSHCVLRAATSSNLNSMANDPHQKRDAIREIDDRKAKKPRTDATTGVTAMEPVSNVTAVAPTDLSFPRRVPKTQPHSANNALYHPAKKTVYPLSIKPAGNQACNQAQQVATPEEDEPCELQMVYDPARKESSVQFVIVLAILALALGMCLFSLQAVDESSQQNASSSSTTKHTMFRKMFPWAFSLHHENANKKGTHNTLELCEDGLHLFKDRCLSEKQYIEALANEELRETAQNLGKEEAKNRYLEKQLEEMLAELKQKDELLKKANMFSKEALETEIELLKKASFFSKKELEMEIEKSKGFIEELQANLNTAKNHLSEAQEAERDAREKYARFQKGLGNQSDKSLFNKVSEVVPTNVLYFALSAVNSLAMSAILAPTAVLGGAVEACKSMSFTPLKEGVKKVPSEFFRFAVASFVLSEVFGAMSHLSFTAFMPETKEWVNWLGINVWSMTSATAKIGLGATAAFCTATRENAKGNKVAHNKAGAYMAISTVGAMFVFFNNVASFKDSILMAMENIAVRSISDTLLAFGLKRQTCEHQKQQQQQEGAETVD